MKEDAAKLSDQEIRRQLAELIGWTQVATNPLDQLIGIPPDEELMRFSRRAAVPNSTTHPKAFADDQAQLTRRGLSIPSWPTLRQNCEAALVALKARPSLGMK